LTFGRQSTRGERDNQHKKLHPEPQPLDSSREIDIAGGGRIGLSHSVTFLFD
jgi:hypothetical protein